MKQIIIAFFLIAFTFAIYKQYNRPPAYNGEPYIYVYGRTSCGYTRQMTDYLKSQGLRYQFFSVDNRDAADHLHARMRSQGINTRSYYLPVVDINGQVEVRPSPERVRTIYYRQSPRWLYLRKHKSRR